MKAYIVKVYGDKVMYYTVIAGDKEQAKHKITGEANARLQVLTEVNKMLNAAEDNKDEIYRID